MWRGDWTHWSHLEQKAERPGGVERRLDSLVALRTKAKRPGGVERRLDSLVALRTKGRATRRCGEEIGLTGRT